MPSVRAAVSLSWMARKARPVGLSIRFTAISAAMTSVTPEIQYQAIGVRARQPNSSSRGTGMPSGPPVKRASLVNTIAIRMPRPSVATAR